MGNQGSWTKWQTSERKLNWTDLKKTSFFQLLFLIRAVFAVLPTHANLQRWGLSEAAECALCGSRATLDQRWRHDQVLREIADTLERQKKKARTYQAQAHQLHPGRGKDRRQQRRTTLQHT